jgi:outer membrane protein OmpA-like peptidoglycan-associated protein
VPAVSNPALSPANLPETAPVPEPRSTPARQHPAAAPQSPPAAIAPGSVTLRAITFEFGSAQLKPQSIVELRNLGIALNREAKDEAKLLIEGHTDARGTRAYNDELSKHRADAVKDYLVNQMGVSADRLETVGRGSSEPANPGNPNGAENRRVVVVNLGAS